MGRSHLLTGLVASLVTTTVFAVVPPEETPLRRYEFRHPDLDFRTSYRPIAELPVDLARQLGSDLSRLGVDPGNAYFDPFTGRWGTLIATQPLVPGPGVGNDLQWSELGFQVRPGAVELGQAAAEVFMSYLASHAAELRVDPAELATPRVQVHGERVIQLYVGRRIDGIPVRGAFVSATINSGNLVLLGARKWGEVALDARPGIPGTVAEASLVEHLEGIVPSGFRRAPRLEIVPVSSRGVSFKAPDAVLRHRLAWQLTPEFAGDTGSWEALVDAHNGEVLSFVDTNHYASRRVEGWIYPVSNDGEGDDGTLQPSFPMPFADISLDGTDVGFTTTGGNVPTGADPGTIATTLSGRYIHVNEGCGVIDESVAAGDLDLEGVVGGTDCAVPPGHSPGDTNAARTVYYELNRLTEQARGYLPDNAWLDQPLTANVNFTPTCGAFWDGSTVSLFRSSSELQCPNTGEIAGIFDHEWGHGMDHNDGNSTISRPGEGIADVYAQNRLVESCIGGGFFTDGTTCHGYGDPCTDCSGVRESDWAMRASGEPHDVDFILANCPDSPSDGPCGRLTHCEAAAVSESIWDLVHRDLMGFEGSPFDLDLDTALELGTRLTYHGSSNVGDWYQCETDGTGGCNADGGYLNYLAVDDDNGDLTDGTPHMSAIFAAFDRHQIACPTPTVQNGGCAGGPTEPPMNFSAVALDGGAELSWDPVPGASEYWIFRTEGVHGCEFGKALIGTTSDTQFTEMGLRNDFEVFYGVVAVGDAAACTSPMSACLAVSPGEGPILVFDPSSLDFGDVDVGTTSPPQTAMLHNAGDAEVNGVAFSGLPDAGFEADTSACGDTLPAGDSCAVSVTFTPAAPGSATATLHVDSDEGATADLELSGDGVGDGGGPVADIQCDSLDFEVPQGGGETRTCNIANPGDADLTWSIDEAEGDALTRGVPYVYDFAATPAFHAPAGYDRASGPRPDTERKPADRVVLPAPQQGVIDELSEGFDDIMQLPGAGWALINNSEPVGPTSWFQGNDTIFPAHEGNPNAYIAANYESTDDSGDISNWLITPEVTIASGTQLTLWTRTSEQFEEFYDRLEVRMSIAGASTDVGDTAESVGDFTELLLTINPDLEPGEYPEEWTQFTVAVSGVPEPTSGRFAFRYWVTDSGPDGTNGDYIGIDTVSIAQTGPCANPVDIPWLAEDPTSGTTSPGGSDPVEVSVDATGLEPGDYTARLCFVTNDPGAPLVEEPVTLTVTVGGPPIADITPESFSFEVPQGSSDSDTLNVGNIGGSDLLWDIDESNPPLLTVPEGAPYRYDLAETPAFNAPVGYDRATTLKRPASVPADRVVLPAPQPAAIGSFTEGFDDIPQLPSAGWALINNSEPVGPSSWFQGNETIFPSHEGAPDAYIAANFESAADGGDISNWLLTPEVTIVNGTTACFWTRTTEQFEEFYDRLEVRMSVAGDSIDVGDTAESVGDFTELLLGVNPDLQPNEYPEEWTEFCVTVRERSRQPVTGRFAFRYWVTDTSVNGDYIGIDTVSVTQPDGQPGGCDNPVDIPWLAADPTSGTTAPGDSVSVTVTVDATDLEVGDHAAQLCVTTNDPDAPLVEVPVSLTVTEGGDGLDVLLAAAYGSACNGSDPQAKIMATGMFDSVDLLDVQDVTPTVAELLEYDAVMVWTNLTPADTPQLSDNLADYVDAGGGVVVTVFANSSTTPGRSLTGRWVDDGYEVIVGQSGNRTGQATLGTVHQPDHPLMEGVSAFDGGSSSFRPDEGVLTPGSASIADWSDPDGIPLIAVHGTLSNRVDLGFYPPSSDCSSTSWDSGTDGARIMANALAYAAGAGNSLKTETNDGDRIGPRRGNR